MLVEVFENNKGGCVIYFSLIKYKNINEMSNNNIFGNYSFEYQNLDILIDSSIKLFELFGHKIFKSSLYFDKKSKKYFLTLITMNSRDDDIISFLKEYSFFKSNEKDYQMFIDEHFHLITKDNAIEVLYNNFQ